MEKAEDRLRAEVVRNELTLRSLRSKLLTCLTFKNGAFLIDPRYQHEANEIMDQEKLLRESVEVVEDALSRATELTESLQGVDRLYPHSWIKERCKLIQRDINQYETNIVVYRRRVESHGSETTQEWATRIKEYEKQLKILRPQLMEIQALEAEIGQIFQGAMKTS